MTRAGAAALALAAVAPLFFSASGEVAHNMVLAATYVVMALGLNVIVGFTGLLDLGYVAFFTIGAFTAAYLASDYWGIHLDFVLVLAVGAAAASLAGVLIGVPTLRLRGDYIAIVTLAFGEIIGRIVANGREIDLFGGTLTTGQNSIGPIDPIELPLIGRFDTLNLRPWYWFALGLVALAIFVSARLRDSRLGRAWAALRDDERTAACSGVPLVRTKLAAYGTGAAFGGISGAFLASYLSFVNADDFEFSFSIFIFSMIVLGGLGSIAGAVAGAILLSVANNWVLPELLYDIPGKFGLQFNPAEVSSGIYGAILVIVMVLRPNGLVSAAGLPSEASRREGPDARTRRIHPRRPMLGGRQPT